MYKNETIAMDYYEVEEQTTGVKGRVKIGEVEGIETGNIMPLPDFFVDDCSSLTVYNENGEDVTQDFDWEIQRDQIIFDSYLQKGWIVRLFGNFKPNAPKEMLN